MIFLLGFGLKFRDISNLIISLREPAASKGNNNPEASSEINTFISEGQFF